MIGVKGSGQCGKDVTISRFEPKGRVRIGHRIALKIERTLDYRILKYASLTIGASVHPDFVSGEPRKGEFGTLLGSFEMITTS
jgi:hypothetical protein